MAAVGSRIVESFNGKPGVDLSAKQWYAVQLSGPKEINAITAANQDPIGILELPPYGPGGAATVCIMGRTKAVAGAAITAGAWLGVDAQGRVVPATEAAANATTGAIDGTRAFARALEAAAAAGEVIEILIVAAGLI